MADLATLAEFKAHLGDDPASLPADAVLQLILDGTEAELEGQCERTHRPFVAAQTARVETKDATGTSVLFLDYPISAITEILLGYDPAEPIESLDPADKAVVIWKVGSARLTRVDCGRFGCLGQPSYVRVTYDALADLPTDAKLAVLDVAANVFRRRGSEEMVSERAGPYSIEFRTAAAESATGSAIWHDAVENNREVLV